MAPVRPWAVARGLLWGAAPDRRWAAVLGPVDPGPPGLPALGPPGASAAEAAAEASAERALVEGLVPVEAAVAAASAGKAAAEESGKLNKKIAAGTKFLPLFFQLVMKVRFRMYI